MNLNISYLDEFGKLRKRFRTKSLSVDTQNYHKANVGIQAIIPPRNYIYPEVLSSHKLSLLDFHSLLYNSHIISYICIALIFYALFAFKQAKDIPFIFSFRTYFLILLPY